MTTQTVTAEELTEHPTDIVDEHGNIPVINNSGTSSTAESVGHPIAPPDTPAGDADIFQAHEYSRQEDTPQTKAAPIN